MTASFFADNGIHQNPQARHITQSVNPKEHRTASVTIDRVLVFIF